MKLEEILGIKKKILLPLVVGALAVFSPRANAQGPPPVSELRGFIDPSSFSIDSVFAYKLRDSSLLASSALFNVDTVTVEGDTVTVPNAYRFVIQGASPGDTLFFRAKDSDCLRWFK